MNKAKLLLPLLLGAALPALAQTPANPPVSNPYARGYTAPHSPEAPAVNAVQGPVTDALNTQVVTLNEAQKAQYDKDMADYRAKVEANARQATRDQARFDNQQRAYADAMFAWRLQTRACERGHVKACRAPTPDPADYY
jgi:outer membrane murein-binding lipoprotein Lpp